MARTAIPAGSFPVVFDAYGTLFDTDAAARAVARDPGFPALAVSWPRLAAAWRTRQLEYSWLRSLAGAPGDFWQVTGDALDWALDSEGVSAVPDLRRRLLDLYWRLAAYPEVPGVLCDLRRRQIPVAILSNASAAMLQAAMESAGIAALVDAALSVDRVGVFKPHPRVYALVEAEFGCPPGRVVFVSANGWDAAAAAGFGFRSVWLNRTAAPVERLPWTPEVRIDRLDRLPAVLRSLSPEPPA